MNKIKTMGVTMGAADRLILSIFPGIDLLGRAFEEQGFCIMRGPDLLWGGDIRQFHPPSSVFWGVIGGPPCQDFSRLRRAKPTGYKVYCYETNVLSRSEMTGFF